METITICLVKTLKQNNLISYSKVYSIKNLQLRIIWQ